MSVCLLLREQETSDDSGAGLHVERARTCRLQKRGMCVEAAASTVYVGREHPLRTPDGAEKQLFCPVS